MNERLLHTEILMRDLVKDQTHHMASKESLRKPVSNSIYQLAPCVTNSLEEKQTHSLSCCYSSLLSPACSCLYLMLFCGLHPYLPCWVPASPAVSLSELAGFPFFFFFFFSSPLFKRILGITGSFKLLWSLLFQALFLVPVPHIIFPWALLAAVIAVTSQYCSADHSHHSSQARVLWDILTSQDVQN